MTKYATFRLGAVQAAPVFFDPDASTDKAKFCIDCGAPLEFHCPQCGVMTPVTGKFYMECDTIYPGLQKSLLLIFPLMKK